VFALAERDGLCFINYFKIFNGTITSTRTYEVKRKLEESNEEVLLAAIDEVRIQNGEEYEELVLSIPVTYENEKVKITLPQVGEKKKLVDLSMKNALYALRQRLTSLVKLKHETPANRILAQMQVDLRLSELPVHIECFDNSNIQGTNPVSACVVFKNARAAKKEYRHFKVQTVVGPDDFATMEEAVFRRYSKFVEEHLPMPQLIIIDGGKGQLSAAMTSLTKLGLKGKVAVIGIAKRLEEIYFPHDSLPLYIDKKSETLKLIQQLRDEAHRFGITFHRELRSKAALVSTLDNIKGIGPESIKILLKEYKLISNMKLASYDDLALKLGNAKAAIVKKYFEEND
jgi:excinuclease ABC subunit C